MYRVVTILVVSLTVGFGLWASDTAAGGAQEKTGASGIQAKPDPAGRNTARTDDSERDVTWEEMIAGWMEVRPIAKAYIIRIDEKYCFPHPASAIKVEIVKEDEDTVWVRGLPPEDPESPLHKLWLTREAEQLKQLALQELLDEHGRVSTYLDFEREIVPPPFMDGLEFKPVPSGLPTSGLWQMNFVIDDMDGDGHGDLVLPPTRKGRPRPWIYLGRPGGAFALAGIDKWSSRVPFDYGGVATGDFDGDGHRDIVLAIHLKGQYVMYGDGDGGFERSERLPSPDPRITSRAPVAADFDGDGREDLAFLAEINFDLGKNEAIEGAPTVWVVRNRGGGWSLDRDGVTDGVIGDNIAAADVDGDGRIDLVLGSNASGWRQLVFLNTEEGWKPARARGVLSTAYHYDVVIHPSDNASSDGPELFWTFVQFQRIEGTNTARTGVTRYRLGEEGLEIPDGPVFFDDERYNPVFRVGAGDLDGDGRTDLVVGRKGGGLTVFVQSESGEFHRERSPELENLGRAYNIELRDLDGDGRDDILAGFSGEDSPGGIRVWLTRGGS